MTTPETEKKKSTELKGSKGKEAVGKILEQVSKVVNKKDSTRSSSNPSEDKGGGVKKFFDWVLGNKETEKIKDVRYEAQHDASKKAQESTAPHHGKEKRKPNVDEPQKKSEEPIVIEQTPQKPPDGSQFPENKKAQEVVFRYLNKETPNTKESADKAIEDLNNELLRPDLPLNERQEIEALKGELELHRQTLDPVAVDRAIDEIRKAKTTPNISDEDKKRLDEAEHALIEHRKTLDQHDATSEARFSGAHTSEQEQKSKSQIPEKHYQTEQPQNQEQKEETKETPKQDKRIPARMHGRLDRMPGVFGIDERPTDLMEGIKEVELPGGKEGQWGRMAKEFRHKPLSADQLEGNLTELQNIIRQRDQLAREGRLTPEQSEYLGQLYGRMAEEYHRQMELAEIPTSFSITRAELDELMTNPIAAMDKWLGDLTQELITRPDDPAAQEMIHRLRLKLSVFLDKGFEDSIASMQIGSDAEGGLTAVTPEIKQKLIEIRNQIGDAKSEYLKSYTTRLKAAQFLNLYTNAAEVGNERFQGLINSIKERDWFSMDGMYGGMVGDAVNVLKRKYESKLWNENGNRRMLTPEDWIDAINETSEELRRARGLNEDRYKQYLSGKYFGVNNGHTMGDLQRGMEMLPYVDMRSVEVGKKEDACRDIANLAALRMMMWLDKATIDIRGLSPMAANFMYGKDKPTEGPATFLRKYKIESIARINSFHTEVWYNMSGRPGIEKRYMRHVGKAWVNASHDLKEYAHERTEDLWGRMQAYLNGSLKGEDKAVLEGELKLIYYTSPGGPPDVDEKFIRNLTKPGTYDRKYDQGKGTFERKRIFKTGKERLLEEVEIRTGIEAAESHWLRPYFNIESGWRNGMINTYVEKYLKDYLSPVLAEKYGTDGAKQRIDDLFLSGKIVKSANEFFMEKLGHHAHGGEHHESAYEKTLKRAALYRPHDLAMAMMEVNNHEVKGFLSGKGQGKETQWKWLSEQALKASQINRQLLQNQAMVMDYGAGYGSLSKREQELVDKVFLREDGTVDTGARDAHFSLMKDLSGFVGHHIHEFTKQQYEPLMTKPRWSDDMPLDLIDSPERLGESGKGKKRFSDILTGGGWDEQSGAMRRNWRDLALAEKAKQLILDSPEANEEEFIKRQKQIYFLMVPYQGEKHAAIALSTNMAGWLGMAKVYPGHGPLLESMKNSSDFKTSVGEMSYSMSSDELHHVAVAVQNETQKFSHENIGDAAGLFHSVEEYLDITSWGKMLRTGKTGWVLDHTIGLVPGGKKFLESWVENFDEYYPWGSMKVKIPGMVLMAALFLLVYTLKEAGEEGKKGGGGTHH